MSLTYSKNARIEQYNILIGDHKALKEKHLKLMQNTEELVNKVRDAEKGQQIAENDLGKTQAALKAANFTISADTDELRERMKKEYQRVLDKGEQKERELLDVVKNNAKLFEQLNKKYNSAVADYMEVLLKFRKSETETTTMENKIQKLIGKVVSAKNRITSLNSNTPYRPGAVERTLADVMEDLRNV